MLEFRAVRTLRDFVLDLALSVLPGETLVMMGENGAGKSTVLNLISGILTPDEGEITLSDRVLFSSGERINVPPENRNIGHLFQSYALFPHMTVAENVAFGLRCRKLPEPEIKRAVAEQLETMNLSELAGVNVGRLSGGSDSVWPWPGHWCSTRIYSCLMNLSPLLICVPGLQRAGNFASGSGRPASPVSLSPTTRVTPWNLATVSASWRTDGWLLVAGRRRCSGCERTGLSRVLSGSRVQEGGFTIFCIPLSRTQ